MSPSTPRPRAVVVYESMFGNTSAIASAVAEGLAEQGVEATITDVREAEPTACLSADLLVLGAPTHAFSLSRANTRAGAVRQGAEESKAVTGLREWIATIPVSGTRPVVATYDTRASQVRRLPVGAARSAARLARRHGLQVIDRPTGFVVTDTKGPLQDGELERGAAWGRMLARTLAASDRPGGDRASTGESRPEGRTS
ncbi:flavodoxin family protein [Nocardioides sp. AN3]